MSDANQVILSLCPDLWLNTYERHMLLLTALRQNKGRPQKCVLSKCVAEFCLNYLLLLWHPFCIGPSVVSQFIGQFLHN